MPQPIPKRVLDKKPELGVKKYTTLLIDGSNVLELSMRGCRQLSSNGNEIGGVFQFLLQLKIMLQKGNFSHVYVFWDGENSGELRYRLNSDYKANRDKNYDETDLSDYMMAVNERIKSMESYFRSKGKKKPAVKNDDDKELFYRQRDIIMDCLEEIGVRQCVCELTEADDFVGYYVSHKEANERIVIMSNDRDLTQLISDDVIVYVQSLKKFINTKNHKEEIGYSHKNVLLKKMLCGDPSDNIKGIKGLGEKTLFTNFPEIREREVTLDEVVRKAAAINESRASEKKKPLAWASNIVNRVTDGAQGDRIYDINRQIIDLKSPLMTSESKDLISSIMHQPLDMEGRSFENLYRIICDSGIDELTDESKFSQFFSEMRTLYENEKKFSEKFLS